MSLLLLFTLLLPRMRAEVFTSMADMEQMVTSEKKMLVALEKYVSDEEKKLGNIKEFMNRVDDMLQHVNKTEDVGSYLGNPVNSYLMLKRFNVDWKRIETALEEDFVGSLGTAFEKFRPFFPTSEDHEGAMDALFRLQTTYNLQASSLAHGYIPGVSQRLVELPNIDDMFELGVHAYKKHNWPFAIQWLTTTLQKLGNYDDIGNVNRSAVLDYLTFALFQFGEVHKAYKLGTELAKLRPGDTRVTDNLVHFQNEIKRLESSKRGDVGDEVSGETVETVSNSRENKEREITMRNYKKLCRGESRQPTRKEQRRLVCWYKQNKPLLRLKPQKVERLWVTPEIFLFHDIIQDSEVKWIKDTARPMLSRATIQDPLTGELTYASYRVSKSTWLSADDYTQVDRIRARTEAITGLNMKYAEPLQIANYGIGGHYEPHFDHGRDGEDAFARLNMGNRIATLLFYLSDVAAGGPTVFTNGEVAVYPVRNAAVFWYNLKRNGKGNKMTRHAACPVLAGQKWVSNYWIHEYGQVLRRPCALNKNW